MPMGCALCGHAPYAHGCPGQGADHDYAQPSRELMAIRLEARRLGVLLPASEAFADAEIIPLVPAQCRPEQPAPATPTPLPRGTPRPFPRPDIRPAVVAPPGRDDGRRPAPSRPGRTARPAWHSPATRAPAAEPASRPALASTPPHHTTVLQQLAHLPDASERRQPHQVLRPGRPAPSAGATHRPPCLLPCSPRIVRRSRHERDSGTGRRPTSWRGGSPAARTIAAALSTAAERLSPVRHAEDLAALLADVHGIVADVHEFTSGNAIVSVHYGLLAYTDGESFWWTSPELNHAGAPILSSALALAEAATQLAEHHAILSAREATDVVRGGLPLLADVIGAEHVDPC
ncbi:hypothetical protein OIE13_31970 [Streptosporangium sp. NBC_01810]|uniref:hypothetical protein n=1 Tax=Streptosporangium sp. NBC_01810 TaxID=2975951 RepID=UPI002DDA61E0|nr:hypothetical protein [Streptosporangium sp. NBC_01810]WSA25484.1 hypothetical protein OIE13_31970 [Streptosporangium sp. NBC_01810]